MKLLHVYGYLQQDKLQKRQDNFPRYIVGSYTNMKYYCLKALIKSKKFYDIKKLKFLIIKRVMPNAL